ncbi:hydroxymethylglutaryl-CoA lyase [Aestuariirhabdus litorea]|uniref:hydroxymethylglutaryl-CoA lyase n=1 Tax=Aestuariirhabdus litorea TaxID=2528527 RepID=A0A3P3VMV0_9GAMM|nr:hydroxymethylglutaryl-CoA lyase [Aestuariirhabdus litorea]RRJ83754.1 hydroxymethylglutaryl-CoA lyase [Aestuariirhabdus litorea]RWW96977.1 hydroxymethylglutaryl-CoA lyase [Endozoicomonadaceae bacterium GTF-13]
MSHRLPTRVRIVEVGPRDGLQNEQQPISTDLKVELIERLANAGIATIEAGSFVNPKWVPQMAGSDEVFRQMGRTPGVQYAALTPNLQGAQRALEAGASELAIFAAASEAFSQKNINCSIEQSLVRFKPVMELAHTAGIPVRGYVSCVVGCPYQGEVEPQVVAQVSRQLLDLGCYEISLGDTIGVGTPASITRMLDAVAEEVAIDLLAVHLHDTYGQAIANIYASLLRGVRVIDSSVAGLGGCPYARGASGNVATEDVLYLLDGLGIEHGINLQAVAEAGHFITQALGRPNGSRAGRALLAKSD